MIVLRFRLLHMYMSFVYRFVIDRVLYYQIVKHFVMSGSFIAEQINGYLFNFEIYFAFLTFSLISLLKTKRVSIVYKFFYPGIYDKHVRILI